MNRVADLRNNDATVTTLQVKKERFPRPQRSILHGKNETSSAYAFCGSLALSLFLSRCVARCLESGVDYCLLQGCGFLEAADSTFHK